MDIVKYRRNGCIFKKPLNQESLPLFKHCSNGRSAVSKKVFKEEVCPVLKMHGVMILSVKDNT